MCPGCSRHVDEHQALRKALGRQIAAVPVPPDLKARMSDRVGAVSGSSHRRTIRWSLVSRVIGAAAVIALIPTVFWWQRGSEPEPSPDRFSNRPAAPDEGQAAAGDVAAAHERCVALGPSHQLASLPAKRQEAAGAINDYFADNLAIAVRAPDLGRYGYEFESANYCGVDGPASTRGGHISYAGPGGSRLSFYSVPRWGRMRMELDSGSPLAFREFANVKGQGRSLAVLAWHEADTTYLCCGDLNLNKMKEMVGVVRTAMMQFDRQLRPYAMSRRPSRITDAAATRILEGCGGNSRDSRRIRPADGACATTGDAS
jgi:hypothetical protein